MLSRKFGKSQSEESEILSKKAKSTNNKNHWFFDSESGYSYFNYINRNLVGSEYSLGVPKVFLKCSWGVLEVFLECS